MFAADISPKCCGTYNVIDIHARALHMSDVDARVGTHGQISTRSCRSARPRQYDFNKDSASRIRRYRDAIALMSAAVRYSIQFIVDRTKGIIFRLRIIARYRLDCNHGRSVRNLVKSL